MRFCRARSLNEALGFLRQWGDEGCVLAGGTDVMVQYRCGEVAPGAFIHIEGIEALSLVSANGSTMIGPLATHDRLGADRDIASRHPALAMAARLVGGWQTQVVGTLGGNICNASPAADMVPPLLVAEAQLTLASGNGERRLPLDAFLLGRRVTARQPDELLTAIELEPLAPGQAELYLKLGRRGAMDVAVVGLALRLGLADDGTIEAPRVAVCSVAATPSRVPEAEAVLAGGRLDVETLAAAGEALVAAVRPIDDPRGTAAYRRSVLPGLLDRAARRCGNMVRQ